jgi:hypothetical protein
MIVVVVEVVVIIMIIVCMLNRDYGRRDPSR